MARFFGHANVSGVEAMAIKGLQALIVVLVAYGVSRTLQRALDRRISHDSGSRRGALTTYKNVTRIVVMLSGFLVALHILGINFSALFSTGGMLAIALAFAARNVAENFISGLMLQAEGDVNPGDVLDIGGTMVRVHEVGLRATIVTTRDDENVIVPNSKLVQDRVTNYTYRDPVIRICTLVGVSYSSDLKKAREVLERAATALPGQADAHAPQVFLVEFGASSVNYRVCIWIDDAWNRLPLTSQLNEAIWWGLKEAGIVIAFPQLDVHFDKDAKADA